RCRLGGDNAITKEQGHCLKHRDARGVNHCLTAVLSEGPAELHFIGGTAATVEHVDFAQLALRLVECLARIVRLTVSDDDDMRRIQLRSLLECCAEIGSRSELV